MDKIVLNGITQARSSGITPLFAAAQRFSELHQLDISWQKRSHQEFADYSPEELTGKYDLLIINHSWEGNAAATYCLLSLDKYLPKQYLDDQLRHSVGCSHLSYYYEGHQWALHIDAATPVASYRADLLKKNNIAVPRT